MFKRSISFSCLVTLAINTIFHFYTLPICTSLPLACMAKNTITPIPTDFYTWPNLLYRILDCKDCSIFHVHGLSSVGYTEKQSIKYLKWVVLLLLLHLSYVMVMASDNTTVHYCTIMPGKTTRITWALLYVLASLDRNKHSKNWFECRKIIPY